MAYTATLTRAYTSIFDLAVHDGARQVTVVASLDRYDTFAAAEAALNRCGWRLAGGWDPSGVVLDEVPDGVTAQVQVEQA